MKISMPTFLTGLLVALGFGALLGALPEAKAQDTEACPPRACICEPCPTATEDQMEKAREALRAIEATEQ